MASSGDNDRPLTSDDSLIYLNLVKSKFHDRSDIYSLFVNIMAGVEGQE